MCANFGQTILFKKSARVAVENLFPFDYIVLAKQKALRNMSEGHLQILELPIQLEAERHSAAY